MAPLRWALKKIGPSNQLLFVSAWYCRVKAKWIEKLDNALKNACSTCNYQQVCKHARN